MTVDRTMGRLASTEEKGGEESYVLPMYLDCSASVKYAWRIFSDLSELGASVDWESVSFHMDSLYFEIQYPAGVKDDLDFILSCESLLHVETSVLGGWEDEEKTEGEEKSEERR